MPSTQVVFVDRYMNVLTFVWIIFQLNVYCVNSVSKKSATFTLESSITNKRIDINLIVENVIYWKLDCMSDCLHDVNCELVGYHGDQKRCRLYSVPVFNSSGVTEIGWEYYAIRENFCPVENFIHNRILDVCYTTFQGSHSCAKSKTMCSSLSANLITVDNQAKQDWARELCVNNGMDGTFFDAYLDNIGPVWKLGSTNIELTYTYWDGGQPDLTGTCMGMKLQHGWQWHDFSYSWVAGVICEIRRP